MKHQNVRQYLSAGRDEENKFIIGTVFLTIFLRDDIIGSLTNVLSCNMPSLMFKKKKQNRLA